MDKIVFSKNDYVFHLKLKGSGNQANLNDYFCIIENIIIFVLGFYKYMLYYTFF